MPRRAFTTDTAAAAARARWAKTPPEQRSEQAHRASLAAAVATIKYHAERLSAEQYRAVADALASAGPR
ncbi:MAG: hypothetical protein M3460_11190 [Actinomycetota bacterium]|nr:hypothetical protein [Actinomycetota bacterium]